MRKNLLLIFLALFSFSAIHAEIEWTLSDDGTLTISGTSMPDYDLIYENKEYVSSAPWCHQKDKVIKVVIKDGVTNIGNFAFWGCDSLASIKIPTSVSSIGCSAFKYCSSLTSVTIPNSVTSIGRSAFYDCSSLTSVTIPNTVTSIGEHVFLGCEGLTSITIPNSVTSIDECAFMECRGLTSITFEGSTPPKFGYDVFEYVNKSIPVYVPANSLEAYKKALGYYFEETSIQALQR